MNIRRAKGFHLYTEDNRRYVDLFCQGGGAVLGHRMGGAVSAMKNVLEKGGMADFGTLQRDRLTKALNTWYPWGAWQWVKDEATARSFLGEAFPSALRLLPSGNGFLYFLKPDGSVVEIRLPAPADDSAAPPAASPADDSAAPAPAPAAAPAGSVASAPAGPVAAADDSASPAAPAGSAVAASAGSVAPSGAAPADDTGWIARMAQRHGPWVIARLPFAMVGAPVGICRLTAKGQGTPASASSSPSASTKAAQAGSDLPAPLPPDLVSVAPFVLAGANRAVYDWIRFLKQKGWGDCSWLDPVLSNPASDLLAPQLQSSSASSNPQWVRTGPWLHFTGSPADYRRQTQAFEKAGVLLPPGPLQPAFLPFSLSDGEKALLKTLFAGKNF